MRLSIKRMLVWTVLLASAPQLTVAQSGVYQSQHDFLSSAFDAAAPKSAVIWLTDEVRSMATEILGHPPAMLRMRYWYVGGRTAWIIDEIGKEKPITMGFVIEDGAIRSVSILEFRESRGWEIRYPFFTEQFAMVSRNHDGELSSQIDSITGATLSVRAATRSATLALALDEHVTGFEQKAALAH